MAGTNYKIKKKQHKVSFGMAGVYVVLTAWALTTIYPLFWILMNSFKNKKLIRSDSFSLPLGELFTLDNCKTAFERVNILGAYRNSIVISLSVAAVILLSGLASYALVRYDFKMKGLLNSMVVAGMMFPAFATIIPVIRMMNVIGLRLKLCWGGWGIERRFPKRKGRTEENRMRRTRSM